MTEIRILIYRKWEFLEGMFYIFLIHLFTFFLQVCISDKDDVSWIFGVGGFYQIIVPASAQSYSV